MYRTNVKNTNYLYYTRPKLQLPLLPNQNNLYTNQSIKTINVDDDLGRIVVVVVTMTVLALVFMVVLVVVRNDRFKILIQPLVVVVLINLMVGLSMVVVVVVVMVVMMMVVVVVTVVTVMTMMLKIMLDLIFKAFIHEFLELDTVFVVLEGADEFVINVVLDLEVQLVTLELVLEGAEFVRLVVVVAVVAVAVVTVVVMRVTVVVRVMHGEVGVVFLSHLRHDVRGLVMAVVVMGMGMGVMSRNVIRVPRSGDRIVTSVVLGTDVGVGGGQSGGKADDGDRDDLSLHF